MVSKKKNILFVWGEDRKILSSGSPFVITRQASWCQTMTPGPTLTLIIDYFILPETKEKYPDYFLLIKYYVKCLSHFTL